ncbi:MAG: PLP-dependent transferase [Clostridia bacterium]|nr:PLP-dependent transferase [Clostridia bacterium]
MKTPICDFVKEYNDSQSIRMHMPGHKGKGSYEMLDITEIDGADVLYNAGGIIKESEENAAALFGSAKTLYSAEGSSLSVRAMLYLAVLYAKICGKKPLIAAGRNAHKTFISAAALLDFDIDWLYGDESIMSCNVTGEMLKDYFEKTDSLPVAVYVTSPDYLGNTLDVASLSEICHAHGVLLLVDNAHGAYLKFLKEDMHPITLGADVCCDSAHKTLPVLTGGGYLHISKNAPSVFSLRAEDAMSLFASTSPSYLILQSLDKANAYLADRYSEKLAAFCEKVAELKENLRKNEYTLLGNEPLKITFFAKEYGYTGTDLAKILANHNIFCEFYDSDFLTLMLTPENTDCELRALESALLSVEKAPAITSSAPKIPSLCKVMSPREATMSRSEEIDTADAYGRILASASVSCPPAIPIAVCGERLDKNAVECFKYYGIEKCRVVNEK